MRFFIIAIPVLLVMVLSAIAAGEEGCRKKIGSRILAGNSCFIVGEDTIITLCDGHRCKTKGVQRADRPCGTGPTPETRFLKLKFSDNTYKYFLNSTALVLATAPPDRGDRTRKDSAERFAQRKGVEEGMEARADYSQRSPDTNNNTFFIFESVNNLASDEYRSYLNAGIAYVAIPSSSIVLNLNSRTSHPLEIAFADSIEECK